MSDVAKIAQGLTKAEATVLRLLDDRDPRSVGSYHGWFNDGLASLSRAGFVTTAVKADGGDGWVLGSLTDLGRAVAAVLRQP